MTEHKITKLILALMVTWFTLLLSGFAVLAAEAAATDVYAEEAVVVTATRTKREESKAPGKTEVITKEEIEASGAATVAEVLVREGLVTYNTGGASGVVYVQLDGAEPEQTLVLINGIPANSGTGGTVDLSYFPTVGIERIEISHGPLSALYGANALGGVVNIITDLTGDAANQVTVTGGSDTYGKLDFAIRKQQYGLAVGGLTTDGHRENSATKNCYLMGQYDFWQTEQKELRLDLLYSNKDFDSPGYYFEGAEPSTDNGTKENLAIDLTGKNVIDQLTVEYKFNVQNYNYDYNSSTTTHYETNIYGSDLAAGYQVAAHQLLGGMQLQQEELSCDETEETWHTGALYLQDTWEFNPKWQLVSGVRWDTGSVYSSPVCPRFGLNYTISDQFTIKLGYGKAFRAPTFDDLYSPKTVDNSYADYGSIYITQGNEDLKPETSDRYEITGEWRKAAQTFSLNCFVTKVVNGIVWNCNEYTADGYDYYDYAPENIAKMRIYGSALSWKNQWNQYLSTGFKYAWTDRQAWDDDTQSYSVDENDCGKNRYTLNLEYQRSAWRADCDWNWVTQRSDNREDYAALNLNLKYQINAKLTYGFSVTNLFDKSYQITTGYPMPGREYYLSANYTF